MVSDGATITLSPRPWLPSTGVGDPEIANRVTPTNDARNQGACMDFVSFGVSGGSSPVGTIGATSRDPHHSTTLA